MAAVGYEYLRETLCLSAFPLERPALVRPVQRIDASPGQLAVPANVAPQTDHPLEHLLFAFKHEGMNLQLASEALRHIAPADLVAGLREAPNGAYIRKACYLWEALTGRLLEDLPAVGGPTVEVFEAEKYMTIPTRRDQRWRVSFNGLGTLAYCPTVRLTPGVRAGIEADVLGRSMAFAQSLGATMLDRALSWAYLSETEDSFAIERETPTQDKAETFVRLLQQAHEAQPLSEAYLVALQNSAMTHPLSREAQFRTQRNWLRGPARGAVGVTYVPPEPELAAQLMEQLMPLAGRLALHADPVAAASIVSFGFVFLHPFMDGNGRLSRFLFHHTLCASKRLPNGLLLPVSMAMKRNENEYLHALKSFSGPARQQWDVTWVGDGDYQFKFKGADSIYRFWDATACVEFGYRMAEQALERDLRGETEFLVDYDKVLREVNHRYDIPGKDLVTILRRSFDAAGGVSAHSRKQFVRVAPPDSFDFIQERVTAVLAARAAATHSAQTGTTAEPHPRSEGAREAGHTLDRSHRR